MKVTSKIPIYEFNGKEVSGLPSDDTMLTVNSHWNWTDRVVLKLGNQEITVLSSDLIKAVRNAENH